MRAKSQSNNSVAEEDIEPASTGLEQVLTWVSFRPALCSRCRSTTRFKLPGKEDVSSKFDSVFHHVACTRLQTSLSQVVNALFLLPPFEFSDLAFITDTADRALLPCLTPLRLPSSFIENWVLGDLSVHFSMHEAESVRNPSMKAHFRLPDLSPDVVEVVLCLSRPFDLLAMREVRPAARALDMSLTTLADMHCAARGVA